LLGVVPELGVTVSQVPPLLVEGVVVKEVVPPPLMARLICCVCGTLLPDWNPNVRVPGVAVNGDIPPELTFNTTGTMVDVFPDVIVTYPPYAPGVSEPGVTDTDTICGAVPVPGVTESQLPVEVAAAVNVPVVPAAYTTRFCAAADPPCASKVSWAG
jgi:hypothetical protein